MSLRKITAAAIVVTAFIVTPVALTAQSAPTGTIRLAGPSAASPINSSWPAYGNTVGFAISINGQLAPKSQVYVTVVCKQGGTVVYQASGSPSSSFNLSDLPGQGLDWPANTSASCSATLIYSIPKGKDFSITWLDQTSFDVAA